jgi:O-antigen ligase
VQTDAANPSRPAWLEWILTLLLGANLAWTTLELGGYRPEARVVTWLLTGSLLVVHLAACAIERQTLRTLHPAGWALVPFLTYGALNVIWLSPVAWLGWLDWFGWANMAATFWVVLNGIRSRAPRHLLFLVLIALGLVAVGLGCHQRYVQPDWLIGGRQQAAQFVGRSSGPFGIPNSLAGFLILLLPAAGALAWRGGATARVGWGWVTAVLGFGLFLTLSRGAWLSLALALVVWPLLSSRDAWRRRLGVAGGSLVVLTLTMVLLYSFAPPARARLDRLVTDTGELSRPILWRAAWQLWRAEPVTGTGAGSFNVLFERHRPAGFVDEPQWAHNDYLNTLSDYGGIGLVLAVGAAVWASWLGRRRRRNPYRGAEAIVALETRAVAAALGVGCMAFAFQLGVDFHLKIPALGMALAVVAALALGAGREDRNPDAAPVAGRGRTVWVLAAAGAVAALFTGVRWQQAEAWYYDAREKIDQASRASREAGEVDRPLVQEAESGLRRAIARWPGHAGAWGGLAHALQFQAYLEPASSAERAHPAEAAARRALAISDVVPDFWLRLGVALDMQGHRDDARAAFERALQLAPRSANGWYYYADHLSRDTNSREAALRAIATCLSLDPGNDAAEALRSKFSPLP